MSMWNASAIELNVGSKTEDLKSPPTAKMTQMFAPPRFLMCNGSHKNTDKEGSLSTSSNHAAISWGLDKSRHHNQTKIQGY